jgi:hypothetical protein
MAAHGSAIERKDSGLRQYHLCGAPSTSVERDIRVSLVWKRCGVTADVPEGDALTITPTYRMLIGTHKDSSPMRINSYFRRLEVTSK